MVNRIHISSILKSHSPRPVAILLALSFFISSCTSTNSNLEAEVEVKSECTSSLINDLLDRSEDEKLIQILKTGDCRLLQRILTQVDSQLMWSLLNFEENQEYIKSTDQIDLELIKEFIRSLDAQLLLDYINENKENKGWTYIPDDNFEQYLIDKGYDDKLDDWVKTIVIFDIEKINLFDVSDLTGITDFRMLSYLEMHQSSIQSINLEKNVFLETIKFRLVDLYTPLELNKNILLDTVDFDNVTGHILDCSNTPSLRSLNIINTGFKDIHIGNTLVEEIYWEDTYFDKASILNNLHLQNFNLNTSRIKTLNFQNNPLLEVIGTDYNAGINEFNASNNPSVRFLHLWGNKLQSVDLSEFPLLERLNISENQLTSLDLSQNPLLTHVSARKNLFSCVTVSEEQLKQIPANWIFDQAIEFSLHCD